MSALRCLSLLILSAAALGQEQGRLLSSDDLLTAVVHDCAVRESSVTTCMRHKVLSFMNANLGVSDDRSGRQLSDESLDDQIAVRVAKYVQTHEFQLQLPEFLFQSAVLTFRPSRGLADFKVDFPEHEDARSADSQARDMLKKKLLLPILLLLKMKMKMITPILLLMVGIKAFKALVLSKISFLLITGFLIMTLCKKLGMPMPMPMPAAMITESPLPVYGPAPTPAPYGAPAPPPDNTYGPWDSSSSSGSGSSYSRWDPHSLAYNSYQPDSKSPSKST